MDSEPIRDENEERILLDRHIHKLLNLRIARESTLVFIPENNLGMEASHLEAMVQHVPNLEVYYDKPGKPGVCKTASITREYQFIMNNTLMQGTIHFSENLFTCTREKDVPALLNMLQDQALRFHWEKKKGNTVFNPDKATITGKVGNKQDDLLITVIMVLYWGRVYTLGRQKN